MAKKAKKQKKSAVAPVPENMLPQNILPIGERVEENKNIYISQAVYKQIHNFTKNKTTDESGGMLVGSVIEEFGKTNIVISGFVEAKYSEGTPTTLKFTHQTWDYVHKEIEKKHKGKKIVGWIHTHPDFGIFLSEYDKFIHQNFFNDDHQVAYVVDPIQNIEGFYFWINGNLEKCKGFYIYDKTGAKITVDVGQDEPVERRVRSAGFDGKNVAIAILSVIVAFLFFANISTNNKLEDLEKKIGNQGGNSGFTEVLLQLYQQQAQQIQDLKNQLIEAGVITAPQESTPPTDPTGPEDPTDGDETAEPTGDPTDVTNPDNQQQGGNTENE